MLNFISITIKNIWFNSPIQIDQSNFWHQNKPYIPNQQSHMFLHSFHNTTNPRFSACLPADHHEFNFQTPPSHYAKISPSSQNAVVDIVSFWRLKIFSKFLLLLQNYFLIQKFNWNVGFNDGNFRKKTLALNLSIWRGR